MDNKYQNITIEELKKFQDSGTLETFYEYFFVRKISLYFTKFLIKTRVTPNQITLLSLPIYLAGSGMFLLGSQKYYLFGVFLLHLYLVLDDVDGEIARAKNLTSNFGHWIDSIRDRVGQFILISSIALGQYLRQREITILVLGIISILNIAIMGSLVLIRRGYFKLDAHPVLQVRRKYYFGFAEVILLITICAIINKLLIVLFVCAFVFPFIWIKQIKYIYRTVKKTR